MKTSIEQLQRDANSIRRAIINVACDAPVDGVHLGSALSMTEIAVALYGEVMRYNPQDMASYQRDRFLLSKGHAALCLYTTLHHYGVLCDEQLATFDCNGSLFPALTPMHPRLGIDFAGGSLGHGVGYASGMALAQRLRGESWKHFIVLGDGECNEGSVWESAFFAAQQKLDNLVAIVDRNGFQSDWSCQQTLAMDLPALWAASGWQVEEVDGHDIAALLNALATPTDGRPKAIVANTVKGKGVSFMENNNAYHRAKLSAAQRDAALTELEANV